MLFYTIVLIMISILFYIEARHTIQMTSRLLPEFNTHVSAAKLAAKKLFIISTCSATSGILMLSCWIYEKIAHSPCPKIILAAAILIYAIGFIFGFYGCYIIKKNIDSKKI